MVATQQNTQATQQLYTHAAEPKAVTQRKAKVSQGPSSRGRGASWKMIVHPKQLFQQAGH